MDMIKKIKLIVLDVDGVLTDGKIIIGSNGIEFKAFSVKDGMGISLAKYAGIKFAIITGRSSEAVALRSKELGIDYLFQGIQNKTEILEELMEETSLKTENVCYMGDDINDIPVIKKVGLSFAPNDAVEIVKSLVDSVTDAKGGQGAVREMIEIILKKQFNYEMLVLNYLTKNEKIVQ